MNDQQQVITVHRQNVWMTQKRQQSAQGYLPGKIANAHDIIQRLSAIAGQGRRCLQWALLCIPALHISVAG